MRAILLIGALSVLSAAQTCPPSGTPADLRGAWGGDHVALVVSDTGSVLEYDCAHGTIVGAVRPGRDGRFEALGTHTREHGGPIREGENPDVHPARYVGRVSGQQMSLSVRELDTGREIGAFTLQRGAGGRVFKCL